MFFYHNSISGGKKVQYNKKAEATKRHGVPTKGWRLLNALKGY